jgi:hypothetical protein
MNTARTLGFEKISVGIGEAQRPRRWWIHIQIGLKEVGRLNVSDFR